MDLGNQEKREESGWISPIGYKLSCPFRRNLIARLTS